ncbi:hypothetical protein FB45DRAFT_918100 [Roridomyces roridus]|uniref:Uncharacterized protein n=1 Tax=Roridomyces roridus TaxID=1738132 RepID=A0AAD7BR21_9AGAR|nr:hypothetical protein FB45DRAFT_918100 [Roridomyces roridus]
MDTRPPPPQGRGRVNVFNRVYRTNLRPVIASLAALSALWSLLSCIGFFRSVKPDKDDGVARLATFAIVIGALYMAMFVIETIGVIAAATQRLAIVRLYAILSFVAIALTVGGGIFEIIVHFTAKSDILKACTDFTEGDTVAVYPFGVFGPSRHQVIDAQDAQDWCNSAFDRGSWQEIISLLLTIFLVCAFSVLSWGYYRQVLDPTSIINRVPNNQVHLVALNGPGYYNGGAPYGASVPNLGYGAPYAGPQGPMYAPPPGAPPPRGGFAPPEGKPSGLADNKGPSYGEDDKENPFADFDERTERDVTSRPVPGGRDAF